MRFRSLLIPSCVLAAAACASEHGPLSNRMSEATTRYLSSAARQPVGWQPWGRDAFALAARLDRPVLLYVGAVDCRWCAMMDREVYANPAVGALIDSLYVPVRVDRDERPDVAARYEAALRSLAGLSGYPLTIVLTPDGSAFFGGTYLPADDPVTGRGLLQVLPEVAKDYREHREFVVRRAALVRQLALGEHTAVPGVLSSTAVRADIRAVRDSLGQALNSPSTLGGFLHTRAVALLLAEYGRSGDTAAFDIARRVLDYMIDSASAAGAEGVRDDPPAVVRAGLLHNLAVGWAFTGDARYRDGGERLLRLIEPEFEGGDDRVVFADRDAYVAGSALEAATAFGDSAAQRRAVGALDTLLHLVYHRGRGVRHAPSGSIRGLLSDQVATAWASLAAYRATGRRRYLDVALDLAGILQRDFADSTAGGYFDSAVLDPAAAALSDRTKGVLDDLLPGSNAWAAQVFLELADATGERGYRQQAEATLEAFAGVAAGGGVRASSYLAVAREALGGR
ncbi:MAG TPA: DUF255 domain-containing protein [Gemmatimonadales bacterium]|nr:DUF255 domain-containing protein [Gemmatimonadales bacterium]